MVEVTAGGITQRRMIMPTRSYLSQTEPIATFGLGDAATIDALRVIWPDQTVQQVDPPQSNQAVTIEQPEPADFAALMNVAQAQLENGRYEQASGTLAQALALRPDSMEAQRNLVRSQLSIGQLDLAVQTLQALPDEGGRQPGAKAYLLGVAAMRRSQYQQAADRFAEVAKVDPQCAANRFQWGLALNGLGQEDQARAEFEQTAQLDPLHGGAQFRLATDARKQRNQEAYRRWMRDYQRIQALKGNTVADATALEACSYTQAEAAPIEAVQSPTKSPWPVALEPRRVEVDEDEKRGKAGWLGRSRLSWKADVTRRLASPWMALRSSATLTSKGVCALRSGRRQALETWVCATLVVGDALVDPPSDPSDGNQESLVGPQPEIAVVTSQRTWLLRYRAGVGFEDLTTSAWIGRSPWSRSQLGRHRPRRRHRPVYSPLRKDLACGATKETVDSMKYPRRWDSATSARVATWRRSTWTGRTWASICW